MPEPVRISRRRARQLAVMGQQLDAPRRRSIMEVVTGLTEVQMDPTSAVARTEHLVLFSRLGPSFRPAQLEGLLWQDRALFEYWAHIVPTADLPIHRISMTRYPQGPRKSREQLREWLRTNDVFVRYVLEELRRRGPLRARDLENRAHDAGRGGWRNDGTSVPEALEILWSQGRVMIVGRQGQQRVWDLASRSLPTVGSRPRAAGELVERQLRAGGVVKPDRLGFLFDGPMPGREQAIADLLRACVIVPIEVEGLQGRWVTHRDLLDAPFRGRTVALSPFDDLVSDRDRTEALFDMYYRIEIYVPKAKRRWGYFVLPVLRGDRLVGRFDPAFDRQANVLRVRSIHMQDHERPGDRDAVDRAIEELRRWLGADEVVATTR